MSNRRRIDLPNAMGSPPAHCPAQLDGAGDHLIIGRSEIAVQHMIKVFAQELGVALA